MQTLVWAGLPGPQQKLQSCTSMAPRAFGPPAKTNSCPSAILGWCCFNSPRWDSHRHASSFSATLTTWTQPHMLQCSSRVTSAAKRSVYSHCKFEFFSLAILSPSCSGISHWLSVVLPACEVFQSMPTQASNPQGPESLAIAGTSLTGHQAGASLLDMCSLQPACLQLRCPSNSKSLICQKVDL